MAVLSEEQLLEKMKQLHGWKQEGGMLVKTFSFPGFMEAMMFVNEIAPLAEAQQHHPDIDIRFNKVTFRLSTHSENGITDKDTRLAKEIDQVKK